MKKFTSIFSIALPLLLSAPTLHATLISQFDGSIVITSSAYINGIGNPGDSNFTVAASDYDSFGDSITIKVTMGDYSDYFRPATGSTLGDMLTSNTKHLWSPTEDGAFITPSYHFTHLGGSAAGWAYDDRQFLTFWGTDGTQFGGGVQSVIGGALSWGQSFTIEIVPEPSAATLLVLGFSAIVCLRRR